MKRIAYCAIILGAFFLGSCLKSSTYERSPIQGGIEIYNALSATNSAALDPIDIAVRLNILLTDAKTLSITDLSKVEVQSDGKTVNVKNALFTERVTITKDTETPNKYAITYPEDYYNKTDQLRRGRFYITVQDGKLLSDPESMWTIAMETSTANNLAPYIEISSGDLFYGNSVYTLTGGNKINVMGSYVGYQSKSYPASWTIDATLTIGVEGYAATKALSAILLSYASQGTTINSASTALNDSTLSTIEVLKYKPSCGIKTIQSGLISGYMPAAQNNPQYYPSDRVTVKWTEGTNCTPTINVSYNGISQDL